MFRKSLQIDARSGVSLFGQSASPVWDLLPFTSLLDFAAIPLPNAANFRGVFLPSLA